MKMEISELKKYVEFKANPGPCSGFDQDHGHLEAIKRYGENYTFMIGHQPRTLTQKEIEERKITHPNIISSIDYDDPYWTDNVGDPLKVDYTNLTSVKIEGSYIELYIGEITVGDQKFEALIHNDCGFAVAYGSPDILKLIENE